MEGAVLISRVETYRFDTEEDFQELLKEAVKDGGKVVKKSLEERQQKAKGEVVQEWKRGIITTRFVNEVTLETVE